MRVLQNCGKLEVRESPIEGFGVFATEDISAGTILEEVPIILFPRYVGMAKQLYDTIRNNGFLNQKEIFLDNLKDNLGFKDPEKYYFKWHPKVQTDSDSVYTVLPLGNGPIYNTSNTSNNADWKMKKDTFVFSAEKSIKKGDEITTFYGYFLGEGGETFNCDNVFHLAIDMFPADSGDSKTIHKVKMLRFGSVESINVQKANPTAHKIHGLLLQAVDGLSIRKIKMLQANQDVVVDFSVPTNINLTTLYQRLHEAKVHPAPLVKFVFEYTDKATGIQKEEEIVWKK